MSFTRRRALVTAFGLGLAIAAPAFAFEAGKFTQTALAAARQTGKPVLVEITAPWCPVCKAQKPTLEKLLGSEKFKSFVTLEMDFDSQKADVASVKADKQSTLIVYKGGTEVGRSVGVSDPAAIEALLSKAL